MASDLLATVRGELDARLTELRPLRAEYERLVAAVEALDAANEEAAAPPPSPTEGPSGSQVSHRGRRRSPPHATKWAPSTTSGTTGNGRKRKRAPRGAARRAILAALEHGSHSASELVSVTGMTGPNIHVNLRRLVQNGTVAKRKRDGKTAYALPSAAGGVSP